MLWAQTGIEAIANTTAHNNIDVREHLMVTLHFILRSSARTQLVFCEFGQRLIIIALGFLSIAGDRGSYVHLLKYTEHSIHAGMKHYDVH